MKNSANGNMYEVTLEETWELFAPYLFGARTAPVCVVSTSKLGDVAQSALESSATALGYGSASCTYVVLEGTSDSATSTTGTAPLDSQALFLLVEGLDPLVLVATDAKATQALSATYRQKVSLNSACRLFGRDAVAFKAFEPMLNNAQDKQAAWALLKKLPRFGE